MTPGTRAPTAGDASPGGISLVDAGDGRRLEQLGERLVDRAAPTARDAVRMPERWQSADLRYDADDGWWSPAGAADPALPWLADVAGLMLELRATSSGGVGLYPEHAANLDWLARQVDSWQAGASRRAVGRTDAGRAEEVRGEADRTEVEAPARPSVLNLFAHTGLATLALARAGAAVAHVDSARSAVAWARRNAELSGLGDRPIRWLVDDAMAFVEREGRRGRRYDGLVLDPPSFGRGGSARGATATWSLREDLVRLLDGCARIATPGAFVLVTAHSTGIDPDALRGAVEHAFGRRRAGRSRPELAPLGLDAETGLRLDLGWSVRLDHAEPAP